MIIFIVSAVRPNAKFDFLKDHQGENVKILVPFGLIDNRLICLDI